MAPRFRLSRVFATPARMGFDEYAATAAKDLEALQKSD